MTLDLDIVCASHRRQVLHDNLLRSPEIKDGPFKAMHIMTGFDNVAKAYNAASHSDSKYVLYCHEDVYLPAGFFKVLEGQLKIVDPDFGVLGVAGVKLVKGQRHFSGFISDRGKPWGSQFDLPKEVDTLDELLIITKGDYRFDENLPNDFYAADVCMQAKTRGKKNYAINAYCEHNSSRPFGGRTDSFFEAREYFKKKYQAWLPVGTTCTVIEK